MKATNGFRILASTIALVGLVSVVSANGVGHNAPQVNRASLQKAAKADLSGKWDLNVATDGGPISAKAEFQGCERRKHYRNGRVRGIWLVENFQRLGDRCELRDQVQHQRRRERD